MLTDGGRSRNEQPIFERTPILDRAEKAERARPLRQGA